MPNLPRCKRCGADVVPKPRSTTQRFCSKDCYDSWWSDFRSRNFTVAQVVAKRNGPPPDVTLNEVQASWLAAMVDGEGTIGIYKVQCQKRTSGFRYRACIQVANTNMALLERIADLVPSGVHVGDQRRTDRHKPVFRATVKSRFVLPLLEAIRPHLVAKTKQADTVMAFCRAQASAPMRSSRDTEIFERLYQENRILNRRGRG